MWEVILWKAIRQTIKILTILALMAISWLHGSRDGFNTAVKMHADAIEYYNYYSQKPDIKGMDFFNEINKHRESIGLHPYQLNEKLCNGLSIRYRQVVAEPDKAHPGFEEWAESKNHYGFDEVGESYVLNATSAKGAVEALLSSPGHKMSLEFDDVYQVCTYALDDNAILIYAR